MSAWNGTCPISVDIIAPNIHLQLSVLMTKCSPRNSWLPRIFKSFVTEDPQKDLSKKVRQSARVARVAEAALNRALCSQFSSEPSTSNPRA